MHYHNQLVLTGKINDVGDPVMENVPSSYRSGIEMQFGFIFTKSLKWDLNGTFSLNKIIGFTEYVDNWDDYPNQVVADLGTTDIAFSPNIIAGSSLQWEPVKGLSTAVFSKFVGKQYIDNTSSNDRALDPYFVNDLLISYEFTLRSVEKFSLSLKINNLFNAEYETNAWVYRYYSEGSYGVYDGYFPQAGINFLIGVDLKF
jgi:iron complex outermembrane receptor protein